MTKNIRRLKSAFNMFVSFRILHASHVSCKNLSNAEVHFSSTVCVPTYCVGVALTAAAVAIAVGVIYFSQHYLQRQDRDFISKGSLAENAKFASLLTHYE